MSTPLKLGSRAQLASIATTNLPSSKSPTTTCARTAMGPGAATAPLRPSGSASPDAPPCRREPRRLPSRCERRGTGGSAPNLRRAVAEAPTLEEPALGRPARPAPHLDALRAHETLTGSYGWRRLASPPVAAGPDRVRRGEF